MPNTNIPAGLMAHEKDFKPDAWKNYTFQELGMFVHLFAKRAIHRSNVEKSAKDIIDAKNYLDMMRAKLAEVEREVRGTLGIGEEGTLGGVGGNTGTESGVGIRRDQEVG